MLDEIVLNETLKEEPSEIQLKDLNQLIVQLRKLRRKYNDELHKKEIEIYEELAESLFELRIGKLVEGKEIKGFDADFLQVLNSMKRIYTNFLSGKYFNLEDKILCYVNVQFSIKNKTLHPGDLILLPLRQVLALITLNYITPLEVE
ncbi:hypothetical protein EWF20_07830 [Sulfolobus sp. S-194]|uniref:hypothetical protein n=1 Tax=Sulfolobus sp. S-194 TaxID=2512240 RepID=UPI00143725C1|nr:hypothetical protein [Sulfolobus sp. S-194]QIW24061.1 hypothetical protein EWF20_07830 [Sulfolobus sp. S-194]